LRKKVLVLCHDTVGEKMAGPGIRYQNLADQIAKVATVTLGVFYSSKQAPVQADIQPVKSFGDSYKPIFDKHDVIFAQWVSNEMLRYAHETGKIIIIDLYAPVPIEYLASLEFASKKIAPAKELEFTGLLETYKQYLTLGDYFVCSNDRQRDFWLGFMTSANIFTPTNYGSLVGAEKIGLCPMGIPSTPPSAKKLELRKRAGLAKDDFVLLWTGGIWDWFDAKVVIEAVKLLDNPKIKLVFMGTKHPNTKIYKEEMSESTAARKLAQDLNLTNKTVFFLDGWVDYKDRANYLMDTNAAIYADKLSVETRFSHRTRVLDHIWAELPTICSKGDYLSDLLSDKGMCLAVERTPKSFAAGIKKAYDEPGLLSEIKSNISDQRHLFTWDELSTELSDFIKNCEPRKSNKAPGLSLPARPTSYRALIPHRVKNSIKVLIGRIDV
jgi:glycosyltransferase involved in cell wall biosynthesis